VRNEQLVHLAQEGEGVRVFLCGLIEQAFHLTVLGFDQGDDVVGHRISMLSGSDASHIPGGPAAQTCTHVTGENTSGT
jgi:hypothetical protein